MLSNVMTEEFSSMEFVCCVMKTAKLARLRKADVQLVRTLHSCLQIKLVSTGALMAILGMLDQILAKPAQLLATHVKFQAFSAPHV